MALTVVWFITAIFSFVHLSPLISVKGKCLPDFQQFIVVYFKTLHFFQQQQLLELKFCCLKLKRQRKGWKKCSRPWILLTKCSVTYCKSSHAETNVSIFLWDKFNFATFHWRDEANMIFHFAKRFMKAYLIWAL